ncbi:MAG TPA: N-formylglutamate amidohydrolase [Acidimicrobiia bacterium]|nr:N-formylglutamate amidohydrolase [Acidimicrobiia bacterium]
MTQHGARPPFQIVRGPGPVVATAIHAGHDVRDELIDRLSLSADIRRREEDPYTDRLTEAFPTRVTVHRSRFEVDLNRPRDGAVYVTPDHAWGLEVWTDPLDAKMVERSLQVHDEFYASMRRLCDDLAEAGRFVVLDLHSYNHRREGPDGPTAPEGENPEVNLGTGSVDRGNWAALVDRFSADLMAALPADTTYGENVRFQGGYLSQWVNETYPNRGCALAVEFKKTFMDEWTDELDAERLGSLVKALEAAASGLVEELAR